jgi:hypothetical protein
VFICEDSWNPSGTNCSVQELNHDILIEDRSQNIWGNLMKLINSKSPIFTSEHRPYLSNPRWWQMGIQIMLTHLTHIPLIHDTFPIHFNKLEMDFIMAKVFRIQKSDHLTHLPSGGLVIDMVLYRALWHSSQFTQWLGNHWGHGRRSVNSSKPSKTRVNELHRQGVQMVHTLKMTIIICQVYRRIMVTANVKWYSRPSHHLGNSRHSCQLLRS